MSHTTTATPKTKTARRRSNSTARDARPTTRPTRKPAAPREYPGPPAVLYNLALVAELASRSDAPVGSSEKVILETTFPDGATTIEEHSEYVARLDAGSEVRS